MTYRYARRRAAILWMAACMFAASRDAAAQDPYPGLTDYIAKAVQTWKIPGMSVAIVRNDSVIYAKGFGVLSAGSRTPVNERTLFEIGSSSKAFTSTLISMLVTDGKMRWDDRLSRHLPDFRMYDPVANEAATIRDALSHRTGIGRGELVWLGAGGSRADVLHRVRFLKPESPFRSRYSYQNMMYLAAGEAAAKAGGSSWDEQVRQRILVPLGMTASVTTSRGLTNPNTALSHGMASDSAYIKPGFNAENIAPAGSILSNAVDMAQWVRFQLGDGTFERKRLVAAAALRETHTPQILISGAGAGRGGAADSAAGNNFRTYAMGWMVEDYRRHVMWHHGGNTPGMTTAVGMIPEKKLGVVVLSNMQSAPLPDLIRNYIFDRALGAPMRDLSAEAYARTATQRRLSDSAQKAQAAAHPADAMPPLPMTAYTGTFADSLFGSVTVAVKDGRLELTRGDWNGPLQYWNASNFRWNTPGAAVTGPLIIKFDISPDNVVTGLYFGLAGDVSLLGRVGGGRGGRGGRGGSPR